ncbi:MAG TPA: glucosidase, partial [Chitinophagaceae bacterium]|nr:glucosidase [Chitinophagaceae bacterium]
NDYIVNGSASINPAKEGTKAAIQNICELASGNPRVLRLRLSSRKLKSPFSDFDSCFANRKNEADEFYKALQQSIKTDEEKLIQRQAFVGMLWNKQFYHYDVQEWLEGDPATPPPPPQRKEGRNADWIHLNNADIISVPDKWEFPWYASWDLAFHCATLSLI